MLLGIEIGGTKLQLVSASAPNQILERRKLSVEAAKGAAGIRELIQRTLPELIAREKPRAIGVGFGGPVDWRTGRISRSHQIEGWSEFDLAGWLQPLVQAPVFADNDANVAALGEAMHRRTDASIAADPVFYVTLGSGVGGGLITHGQIYHGAKPGEAEIGHVRLDPSGTTVESRCSGWAVDARIRALADSEPNSFLARQLTAERGGEARHFPTALAQRDSAAARILQEIAGDLAFGLSHVVHLFHPELIILGGGLSHIGERLRAAVETALRPFVMEAFLPGPQIALAALGEDAVPVGAIELARTRLSSDEKII
jgi:glucokinase